MPQLDRIVFSSSVSSMKGWSSLNSMTVKILLMSVLVHMSLGFDLTTKTNDRRGKLFSLFNIVTFKQGPCRSISGDTGVCMTMLECAQTGSGTPSGNCASGFGVCCLIRANQCGADITRNCTYFTNPEYPGFKTDNTPCDINIRKCDDNICFLKLDYEESCEQERD